MKNAVTAARILLGLIYFVFGLNYFLKFLPLPEMSEAAGSFIGALIATGYLFAFVKIVEIVAGAALLAGVAVPLAGVVLAPITLNIFLLHVFLDPGGAAIGVVLVALQIFLAWAYRDSYKGVLDLKAKPSI